MNREYHERKGFAAGLVVLQVPYSEGILNCEVQEERNAHICPHLKTSDKIVFGELWRSWELQTPTTKYHKEECFALLERLSVQQRRAGIPHSAMVNNCRGLVEFGMWFGSWKYLVLIDYIN